MSRRNLLSASTLSSGGVQEPEWPVYLTLGDNGDVGIQLYNYLISILPEDTVITLPTTKYKIGDIVINSWGAVASCNLNSYIKSIMIRTPDLDIEGYMPSLRSNGFLN